jgi:Tannase and feruloyl esterase
LSIRNPWLSARLILTCVGMASSASFGQATHKCADVLGFETSGEKLEITKAESTPASAPGTMRISPVFPGTVGVAVPSFCRVEGVIDRRTGADGKPYGIRFALSLPDKWNGRFLFQGGGGLNGSVALPLGSNAAGEMPALVRGFAVVDTDSGHEGAVFDGSFFRDQQASLDFYYVAIGRVTVVAKQIISWYFGRAPEHSYYSGCSTGGREGMIMSQRYPSYFDGIVSGSPAMRTGHSNLSLAYIGSVFSQAVPKNAAGKTDARELLADANRKLVISSLLEKCDALDGVKDGMIFNFRSCGFNPSALVCKGDKTEGCLSEAQAGALQKAFAGPKTLHGDSVYPGFPWDTGMAEKNGIRGLLYGPTIPVPMPSSDAAFSVDSAAARVESSGSSLLGDSTWTNLSSFRGHGGKLIFYHGMSDPWFSALDTIGYYERMAKDTSGGSAADWSRLFLAPGMGHCQGGSATLDRFDMLTAIVDWVEKGKAPDEVVATGKTLPGRSRPLCPYPQHAQYKGSGDTNDAGNFVCQE